MFENILKSKMNWERFFNLVKSTGDDLNRRKDRFDKSDIFEQALDAYSDGVLEWVDQIGYDHIIGDHTSEMKTQKFCLYNKNGSKKSKTSSIKLMNSLGDASGRTKDQVIKFDYLKIVDTGSPISYSVAFVHKNDIREEWMCFGKDGVTLQIPTEFLTFVIEPENLILENNIKRISYIKEKQLAQRRYIESF